MYLMCGFSAYTSSSPLALSLPSPPEVTAVVTSSTPRVEESGSQKSALSSLAKWTCTSPVSTTGVATWCSSQVRTIWSRSAR